MKTIRQEVFEAHQRIDIAAGETSLKYITSGPGQEARYAAKLQQARAYRTAHAADPSAPVPPYISREASRTGASAIAAAVTIDEVGTWWMDGKSVDIDDARLTGKDAVTAASLTAGTDDDKREAIATAEAAARDALEAL